MWGGGGGVCTSWAVGEVVCRRLGGLIASIAERGENKGCDGLYACWRSIEISSGDVT